MDKFIVTFARGFGTGGKASHHSSQRILGFTATKTGF